MKVTTTTLTLFVLLVVPKASPAQKVQIWREHTFEDFRGGLSAMEERIRTYPPAGAFRQSTAGMPMGMGILTSCFRIRILPSPDDVPSFIYWNSSTGFDKTRRTPIYEHGAAGNTVADFNGDGHLDILFLSQAGRSHSNNPKFVYWGNKEGRYGPARRLELPGNEAYDI